MIILDSGLTDGVVIPGITIKVIMPAEAGIQN